MSAAGTVEEATTMWGLVEASAAVSPDVACSTTATTARSPSPSSATGPSGVAAGLHDGRPARQPCHVAAAHPHRDRGASLRAGPPRRGAEPDHADLPRPRGRLRVSPDRRRARARPGHWRGFDYVAMVERIAADLGIDPPVLVGLRLAARGRPGHAAAPRRRPTATRCRWIYYTSGTTSDPKGVQHTDATLIAGGLGLAEAVEMQRRRRRLDRVPVHPHRRSRLPRDHALPRLAGRCCVEAFVLDDAVELFAPHGATMAGGVDRVLPVFLTEQRKQPGTPIIPTLRLLSGGGAPKPPRCTSRSSSEMGIPVCHGYGMTECPMIAQGRPDDTDDQLAYTEGTPVAGCEIAHRTRGRHVGRPGRGGRGPRAGPMVFKGYTDAVAQRRRLRRRRLVPHRRPRRPRRRRPRHAHRPPQGRHHPQGREHLGQGDRGPPLHRTPRSPTSR